MTSLQNRLSCTSVVHVWLSEIKKCFSCHLIKVGLHLYYYLFQCLFCWQISLGLRSEFYYGSGTAEQRGTRSCQLYESLHLQCVYFGNSYCNNIKKDSTVLQFRLLGVSWVLCNKTSVRDVPT